MEKLSGETIRSVCSGQVITSPYSIVKELVENSLDAGSSIIEIRLEENGLSKIEIRDNGCGIKEEDRPSVALPHFTSKLQHFSDISCVNTYGFRGEAVSAICSVAKVAMITRHSSDKIAKSYTVRPDGVLTETGTSHNNVGTTFTVTDLFKNLPVRKKFYQGKKGKEQLSEIDHFVRGIAIANPSVRFMLRHNRQLVWQHASSKQLKDSISSVYGSIGDMTSITYSSDNESEVQITGMLSASAKSTRKPPFIIVNKRLVKFKALLKSLKKLYDNSFPNGAVCISLHSSLVDVNVEVDKSAVICKNEAELISIVEDMVSKQVLNIILPQQEAINQTQDFYDRNLTSQSDVSTLSPDFKITDKSTTEETNNCAQVSFPLKISSVDNNAVLDRKSDQKGHSHLFCTPEILGGRSDPDSHNSDNPPSHLASPENTSILDLDSTDRTLRRPPIYSDDEEEQVTSTANLSMWSELEKDLDSQELFSPTSHEQDASEPDFIPGPDSKRSEITPLCEKDKISQATPQKLENIITDNSDGVKSKSEKNGPKQSSIYSWSQGNTEFKMELISPEQIMKQAAKNVKNVCSKKRGKSISPNLVDKRRKLSTPSPTSKPPKNKFTFNLHYLKETLLFKKRDNGVLSCSKALKLSKEWIVLWEDKIFAFNPTKAQEVNLYRKLMGSHSLKYGPSLPILDGSFDLRPSDLSQELYSFLMSCPTSNDPMGEHSYINEKSLAINGIRINKVNEGLFRITNVCEDVPEFGKEDVIETLELIVQQNNLRQDSESDLTICDYSSVRCEKICQYLKGKAAKVSRTFASFEPSPTDVMDLFSNTHQADSCVHGHSFREVLWEF